MINRPCRNVGTSNLPNIFHRTYALTCTPSFMLLPEEYTWEGRHAMCWAQLRRFPLAIVFHNHVVFIPAAFRRTTRRSWRRPPDIQTLCVILAEEAELRLVDATHLSCRGVPGADTPKLDVKRLSRAKISLLHSANTGSSISASMQRAGGLHAGAGGAASGGGGQKEGAMLP